MNKCGICLKPAVQLFETGKDGTYACFKCQPLVPEVTIDDESEKQSPSSVGEEDFDCFVCGICNKTFNKSMQLQNHMRNHRAERRFVCTYCNKAFSQSNNLRAHLRIHTNERPYKCQECGKAFTQVTNLNNHVRLHTGERPFVCPEPGCDKAYAQVTNLNQHLKRHVSGRPDAYDCNVCGARFSQRNHMYVHRRQEHDIKSPPRSARAHGPGDHPRLPAAAAEWGVSCVFSSCGARLASAREHTDHLLRAHQLRVLAARDTHARRGRPPKMLKDPLDISEHEDFAEVTNLNNHVRLHTGERPFVCPEPGCDKAYAQVKMIKEEPQYLPKLKIESLFQ